MWQYSLSLLSMKIIIVTTIKYFEDNVHINNIKGYIMIELKFLIEGILIFGDKSIGFTIMLHQSLIMI